MRTLVSVAYKILPFTWLKRIGSSKPLKPVRNFFLRKNGRQINYPVSILREYNNHKVNFTFIAPIRTATLAQEKGIENRILRNSMTLLRKKGVGNNAVIFDIGANFGYLSLVWAKSVCSKGGGKVHSFEPSITVYSTLKESIRKNLLGEVVKLNNLALGKESGVIQMYDAGTTANVKRKNLRRKPFEMKMTTLDSYCMNNKIDRLDLIKIDVDGIELDILKGGKETLKKYKPILVVETNNNNQIVTFCKELGYSVYDMDLSLYSSETILPVNVFCD